MRERASKEREAGGRDIRERGREKGIKLEVLNHGERAIRNRLYSK